MINLMEEIITVFIILIRSNDITRNLTLAFTELQKVQVQLETREKTSFDLLYLFSVTHCSIHKKDYFKCPVAWTHE